MPQVKNSQDQLIAALETSKKYYDMQKGILLNYYHDKREIMQLAHQVDKEAKEVERKLKEAIKERDRLIAAQKTQETTKDIIAKENDNIKLQNQVQNIVDMKHAIKQPQLKEVVGVSANILFPDGMTTEMNYSEPAVVETVPVLEEQKLDSLLPSEETKKEEPKEEIPFVEPIEYVNAFESEMDLTEEELLDNLLMNASGEPSKEVTKEELEEISKQREEMVEHTEIDDELAKLFKDIEMGLNGEPSEPVLPTNESKVSDTAYRVTEAKEVEVAQAKEPEIVPEQTEDEQSLLDKYFADLAADEQEYNPILDGNAFTLTAPGGN